MVEDNPVNMLIAVALLEQWGVAVDAGQRRRAGGRGGRLRRADAGRPFDAVLMDVQMPVHERPRGHARAAPSATAPQALPIIALTAAALVSERDEALAAGMNDFLTKPIDAQRLHDTLLQWQPRGASLSSVVTRQQRCKRISRPIAMSSGAGSRCRANHGADQRRRRPRRRTGGSLRCRLQAPRRKPGATPGLPRTDAHRTSITVSR